MDAFEQVIAGVLWSEGYWTQTSVKVDLTKEEKRQIGRPSAPRWELDVVAYSGASNEVLVVECKSYLDSYGVRAEELDGLLERRSSRYKLFVERDPLRQVVFRRLREQMASAGFWRDDVSIKLALACGKIHGGATGITKLQELAVRDDWTLIEPSWIKERLTKVAETSYENEIASVVAKLLLR